MDIPVFEYLAVLKPDDGVSARIKEIKNYFQNEYGCEYAAQLKPHCTLLKFPQYTHLEKQMIKRFESIARTLTPAKLNLDGFGNFPHHTIYVGVDQNPELEKIMKNIKVKLRPFLQKIETLKPVYVKKAHITIARKMNEAQFELAWDEWKNRPFKAIVNADEILLLKRPLDPETMAATGTYQRVDSFKLSGSDTEVEQLLLF